MLYRSVAKPRLPASAGLFTLILFLFLTGCAGVKPSPRYTDRSGSPPPDLQHPPTTPAQPPSTGLTNLDSVIESWWGTPYRSGGESKRGVDCSAYVRAVYADVWNKPLPRLTKHQFNQGWPVNRPELRRGDLVFFNTDGHGVSHVGIYLGSGRFTHASVSKGVTIDDLSAPYYAARYLGARRIP